MTKAFAPADPPDATRPTLTAEAHADLGTRLEILIAEYASAGDRLTATAKLHAILARVDPAASDGAVIASSSVGSPTVLTTVTPHGFSTGDDAAIDRHAGSTPDLNGSHLVTVIDATHFSVPVDVTRGGSGGVTLPVARPPAPVAEKPIADKSTSA
jgi:hypothetical protein